jgi:hypothetical protein
MKLELRSDGALERSFRALETVGECLPAARALVADMLAV